MSLHWNIGPMKRSTFVLVVALLLFVAAHRLPAPISEVPQKPILTSEEQAKPRKVKAKRKTVESKLETKSEAKPSVTPALQGPARFAGTWTGTINQGILGDMDISLVINAAATSVKEISKMGTFNHPASFDGDTMKWHAGLLNEIAWTLTPASDGKSAATTSKSGFGVNGASIFHRTSDGAASISASEPAGSAPANQRQLPTARPVPDRPGFVYNPFDSNSKVLLDVRGHPSGSKVKDPSSGRLFIVP
jgi:hypothetical protein